MPLYQGSFTIIIYKLQLINENKAILHPKLLDKMNKGMTK